MKGSILAVAGLTVFEADQVPVNDEGGQWELPAFAECRKRGGGGQTTAPSSLAPSTLAFGGLMNCSRETPSHITSGAATSTEE